MDPLEGHNEELVQILCSDKESFHLTRFQIAKFPESLLAETLRNDSLCSQIHVSLTSEQFKQIFPLFDASARLDLVSVYNEQIQCSLDYLNLPRRMIADAKVDLVISLLPSLLEASHESQCKLHEALVAHQEDAARQHNLRLMLSEIGGDLSKFNESLGFLRFLSLDLDLLIYECYPCSADDHELLTAVLRVWNVITKTESLIKISEVSYCEEDYLNQVLINGTFCASIYNGIPADSEEKIEKDTILCSFKEKPLRKELRIPPDAPSEDVRNWLGTIVEFVDDVLFHRRSRERFRIKEERE